MIISHKYMFIFIKTVKTASTSIEVFLSDKCAEEDIFTPIYPHVTPHRARNFGSLYNHIPAFVLKSLLSDEMWKNYFIFCVERNPWDKVLSHYHMMNYRSGFKLSFDQFLLDGKAGLEVVLNFLKYMDRAGQEVIVNRVLRYENLNQELGEVFGMLGIPYGGSLNVYAKSDMRTDRRPYQEVYTKQQKRFVKKVFEREIVLHGYVY